MLRSNASMPTKLMGQEASDETEDFYKRVRCLINKLTLKNYDSIACQIKMLKIDTQEQFQGVFNIIYGTAICTPTLSGFFKIYALLVKALFSAQVSGTVDKSPENFLKMIVNRSQVEFDLFLQDESLKNIIAKIEKIEECTRPEQKQELQKLLEEEERMMRMKLAGNISFTRELFKNGILEPSIMCPNMRNNLKLLSKEIYDKIFLFMHNQKLKTDDNLLNFELPLGKKSNQGNKPNSKLGKPDIQRISLLSLSGEVKLREADAQKNEENSKVSALRASSEKKVSVIEKQDENAVPNQLETPAPKGPVLKYTYQDDQWSPLNTEGKRVYGREFLMKLEDDPNSKIKPLNLPDLDVVLKDSTKIRQYASRNRSPELRSFKDQNLGRHDSLYPGFVNANKNSMNARMGNMELQFLSGDCKDLESKNVLSLDQIHAHLKKMMKETSCFDDIYAWIKNNVGDKVNDPQFIRVLMTAILEVSTVFSNNRHEFKPDIFQTLEVLIQRFVDANEKLELQCLFAAQAFANKLEFPFGLLLNIFDKLWDDNVISFESFIQWESNDDAAEREGKAVALKVLTSFFPSLKEIEEESEEEWSQSGELKLRESENAWKPARLKASDLPEEESVTQTLYKKVRSVLNKLTPQKFDTLVSQVRALAIDTKERMDGVINLIFEKVLEDPRFSAQCALLCKELAQMQVSGTEPGDSSATNFRKSIITRCQMEFENDSKHVKLRLTKSKEIEECTDPEKKKKLLLLYEEEERRIRMKSVGNIRFIGELFKQGMLTKKIMHFCINHLLQHRDEETLECLCKLLTTIGKNLEINYDLKDCIKVMKSIANDKGPNKISSRVRFMIQDVIDLRVNKWVPRRDDSNPKTMDQIQRDEAESERLDSQLTIFNELIQLGSRNAYDDNSLSSSTESYILDGVKSQNISMPPTRKSTTPPIDNEPEKSEDEQDQLRSVTTMIDEGNKEAIRELLLSRCSEMYALLVKAIVLMKISDTVNFKKIIEDCCLAEIESYLQKKMLKKMEVKEIKECIDPEKKKELEKLFDEEQKEMRIISIHNIRFMGELFKYGMLKPPIMFVCLTRLLEQKDDESLVFLCKLLAESGKKLEVDIHLNNVFEQMQKIVNEKDSSRRVYDLLQDVFNLRANNWLFSKDENIPKIAEDFPK